MPFKCPSPTLMSHTFGSKGIVHPAGNLHIPSYWCPKKPAMRPLTFVLMERV